MSERLFLPSPQVEIHRDAGATMTYGNLDGGPAVVADRDVRAALAAGATRAHVQVAAASRGWPCPCGHQSVFKVCGRCGRKLDE